MNYLIKISYSLLITISCLLLLQPATCLAQQDSSTVQELLEERDQEIKDLVGPKGTDYTQEQRDQMKDIINGIIDYREMARYALQDTYERVSDEQREEFIDLFSTIVRDQSMNNLDIYRADVKYEEIKVENDSATVRTIARLEKVRTPVIYQMKYKNNQWVVTDMIIDDVSTAESYRKQFQRIISKKGFDSLLETLRKRAERSA